jgi:hypothetical protein
VNADCKHLHVRVTFDRTGSTIAGLWMPNQAERQASWETVVEFATRITLVPLRENEGLLNEALGSLFSLFSEVRGILRRNGPDVALDRRGELSYALLAGHLLNQILRPVNAYWHPRLEQWLQTRPAGMGELEREQQWSQHGVLLRLLDDIRQPLSGFARVFAEASGSEEFLRAQLDNETRLFEQLRRQQVQGDV